MGNQNSVLDNMRIKLQKKVNKMTYNNWINCLYYVDKGMDRAKIHNPSYYVDQSILGTIDPLVERFELEYNIIIDKSINPSSEVLTDPDVTLGKKSVYLINKSFNTNRRLAKMSTQANKYSVAIRVRKFIKSCHNNPDIFKLLKKYNLFSKMTSPLIELGVSEDFFAEALNLEKSEKIN